MAASTAKTTQPLTATQRARIEQLTAAGFQKVGRARRRNRSGAPVTVRMIDPTGAEQRVWIGAKGLILPRTIQV
jgi:ribosomal protein S12 methylthiotransferase accessory factor YcaO